MLCGKKDPMSFLRRHYPDQVRGSGAAFRAVSAGFAPAPLLFVRK